MPLLAVLGPSLIVLKAFAYAYAAYCVFGGLLLMRGLLPDFVTIVIADLCWHGLVEWSAPVLAFLSVLTVLLPGRFYSAFVCEARFHWPDDGGYVVHADCGLA
ncbi:MAG: hypothetical protein RQ732_02460 [Methylophaga sp.]|nr:hypothetical protein [Methylophaga sp.]